MTPKERADRARDLIDDAVLKEAFYDIRMGLVAQLEGLPFGDVDTQHEVALMLQLLRRVRTQLDKYLGDQKVIEARDRNDSFIEKVRKRIA